MISQPMTVFEKVEGDGALKGFGSAWKENYQDEAADTQYLLVIVLYNFVPIKKQRKEWPGLF